MTQSATEGKWTNSKVALVCAITAALCGGFFLLFLIARAEDSKPISYNQCLLQNLKGSTERFATVEIVSACARMYTKVISIALKGTAKFDSATRPTTFTADLINPDSSYRITKYIVVVLSIEPPSIDKQTGNLTWTSNHTIEPNGSVAFVGAWSGFPMSTPWTWYAIGTEGVKLN